MEFLEGKFSANHQTEWWNFQHTTFDVFLAGTSFCLCTGCFFSPLLVRISHIVMHMSETRVVQRSPANSTPAKLSVVQTWVKINVCTTFLKTTKIIQNHWSLRFFCWPIPTSLLTSQVLSKTNNSRVESVATKCHQAHLHPKLCDYGHISGRYQLPGGPSEILVKKMVEMWRVSDG